jgi:hypothetical protein
MHNVILDPRHAANTLLGDSELWCDEDFEEEVDEEEADPEQEAADFADKLAEADTVSSGPARKTPRRADLVVSRGRAG